MLIGAGVGALGSALTGSNPLKGAALGAAGGGLGSAAGLFGGASGIGSVVPATAGKVATDLSTGQILASAVPNTTGVNAFLGEAIASPIGMSSLPTAGVGAFTQAPSIFDSLSKYATIDNLSGAAKIASQYQPKQPSPAPQGRVSQGQAPQGGLGQGGVEGLLAELEKQRQTQRQPISLLVG